MLEGLIARYAANNATASERSELESMIDDMRAAVQGGDQLAYSKLNALLHRRLREISRHLIANELVANLRNPRRSSSVPVGAHARPLGHIPSPARGDSGRSSEGRTRGGRGGDARAPGLGRRRLAPWAELGVNV